jgi:hypothetical protein
MPAVEKFDMNPDGQEADIELLMEIPNQAQVYNSWIN